MKNKAIPFHAISVLNLNFQARINNQINLISWLNSIHLNSEVNVNLT